MRPARLMFPILPLLACLLLAGPTTRLAAQADDDRWQRRCENGYDGDDTKEHFCEVRHTGFRPGGTRLVIDPDDNGGVEIEGWDRDSVAVTLRVQAGARTEEDAKALAGKVRVEAAGSTIRVAGPTSGRRESWSATLILRVPRRSDLDVETVNGPLAVSDVRGTMNLRATNGPISLEHLAGDVRARVQNGPLSVELAGASWDGKGLDAESVNGPVQLGLPEGYNAELETGTVNGPMNLEVPITVTLQGRQRDRIRTTLGKGGAPVRVVTTNGPITIGRAD